MIDLGINLFQEIAALGGGGGGFSVTNSLRFNDDDSAYLSRTPSVAGDRKTWTWSAWVKRGNLGGVQGLFSTIHSGTNKTTVGITGDVIDVLEYQGSTVARLITNASFRDVSGWYHIVVVWDSSNATSSDRVRLYINGTRVTSFGTATYPSLNALSIWNTNVSSSLATWNNGSPPQFYFDGYMSDVNFIDGQALTADDFGQIDSVTGEWSPKKYSGTYGTNGFYLEFKDGSALGDDTSGNTNDWTPTNLASTDQMLDTPTNNFATWNPLNNIQNTSLIAFSEGNLLRSESTSTNTGNTSTIAPSSGKWYWEAYIVTSTNTGNYAAVGRLGSSYLGVNRAGVKLNLTGTASTYGGTGNLIGVAIDLDAGTFDIYENGVLDSSLTFTPTGEPFSPAAIDGTTTTTTFALIANFGADSSFAGNKTRQGNTDANGIGDFYYTPPTGHLALCTDNLPEPAIVDSETQFNVVLDTGANIKATAETLYDSSLVWIKDRANSNNHQLIDTVRGTGVLQSNTTAAETTYSAPSGNSVAWVWKAGGTAVSNTDGSITSQVSANVNAGFSIVSYTGTRTSAGNDTIGHGLNSEVELVISKSRSNTGRWVVQHGDLGSDDYLELNTTAAVADSVSVGAGALPKPTSSVFYGSWLQGLNINGENFIAYCFHSVEGFSKFGSYVGNGSTDGPFVYTGFRPAFVMVKATSTTGGWEITDATRTPENVVNKYLYANLNNAESTFDNLDFLSNGFKLRATATGNNTSGVSYIYMAFAESPFKNSVAR